MGGGARVDRCVEGVFYEGEVCPLFQGFYFIGLYHYGCSAEAIVGLVGIGVCLGDCSDGVYVWVVV